MHSLAKATVKSIKVSAVIKKKDGRIIDCGVIAHTENNSLPKEKRG